jgi:hypothetical protein
MEYWLKLFLGSTNPLLSRTGVVVRVQSTEENTLEEFLLTNSNSVLLKEQRSFKTA